MKRSALEKFSYINRGNMEFVEELYQKFLHDPDSVEPQWKMFFDGVEFGQSLPAQGGFSLKEFGVYNLIEHYRSYGHLKADLDPLHLQKIRPESFELDRFHLEQADLDATFQVGSI